MKILKNKGVYTCIHPNKIEIESFELVYYGNILYNVSQKFWKMGVYTCLHSNKASWKFWKMGVYTCIHPNKRKVGSIELIYYGNTQYSNSQELW